MNSNAIRQAFLEFFRQHDHEIVPSSSLVPGNDPSLLFTNAGMVQFKEVFLGIEQRARKRAASSQRCVRAGGKHNDLENVGYTARHHTFFEMLGNFSFGDYFKAEAIAWAWELLTVRFGLPAERLWVSVHESDEDAASIWLHDLGIDPARFSRCGDDDNFWMMGNTGPCGPCSEIFFDHGPEIPGGPPGTPDAAGDRYVEIWNLVFTQYDRDEAGTLNAIPHPSVDTGMGLERIAAALQGVHNNYDIDLFRNLMTAVHELAGHDHLNRQSVQVIADHIRSCAFLIADGVVPANDGRGYVLRRIIRRALRHGHKLGFAEPFFHRLVGTLEQEMGEAYPLLTSARGEVERVLLTEEQRFTETLDQGMRLLDESFARMSGTEIPGDVVFRLYDTYGFPSDLTADIARERGMTIDQAGFEAAMQEQRERARAASRFSGIDTSQALAPELLAGCTGNSSFTGYSGTSGTAMVLAVVRDGQPLACLQEGESAILVLDSTPFYAESGGQIGDRGRIFNDDMEFVVTDTRQQAGVHLHYGILNRGRLEAGITVTAAVDAERRQATRLNHSATHLMHAALRRILGSHVAQKGSLVEPERLRFDFSHTGSISHDDLAAIEAMVNGEIRQNLEVVTELMPYQQAVDSGAVALFGEKYGDTVRVLRMGDFSTELCGGTHVARTGDIGLFKIITEGGIASGVRRIEAVTGSAALDRVTHAEQSIRDISELLKAGPDDLALRVDQMLGRLREQEREIERLKTKLASGAGVDLAGQAVEINGAKVLACQVDGADAKSLRTSLDRLKDQLGDAAVVLATVEDGKVKLVAGVTKSLTNRVKAGELVNFVAEQVGGRGGGRPDMAQAGGDNPDGLPAALASVTEWVTARLR